MKRLTIILLMLVPFLATGQVKTVDINWKHTDSTWYFDNAGYRGHSVDVPVWSALIPWNRTGEVPVAEVKVQRSEQLGEPFSIHIENKEFGALPRLEYQLVFENRRPLLQVSVEPFYREPVTGNLMKVESFALDISGETPMAALKSLKRGTFSNSSLLASNDWYKISVGTSGIHKLTYEDLEAAGLGNPSLVRIYGAGAVLLPEDFSKGSYDDLTEVPYYMNKGADQLFGPGDYILFYANGPVQWEYDADDDFFGQELHHYSEFGYYFLTDDLGPATPIETVTTTSDPAGYTATRYDILAWFEEENFNLLKSGREWYADLYDLNLVGAYPFTLSNLTSEEPLRVRVTAAGRSNETSEILVTIGGTELGRLTFNPVNLSSYTSTHAIEQEDIFPYVTSQETVTVQVEYEQPNTNSEAWLNKITLNGRARLEMEGDELTFRDRNSVGFGNVTEFRLGNSAAGTSIWEITDRNNPGRVNYTLSGNTAVFKLPTDELRTFIAFDPAGSFPVPRVSGPGLGKVTNQDLHGTVPPDLVIIYAEEFLEQAQRLAEHRQTHDNLDVLMITQEMIFNEFSSGTPDIGAIRNYLKMYYDNFPPGEMPKYLLLFGDGSYDNRDTVSGNPNMILTYQSPNSLVPTGSYVSDDFFGLLDTGEKLYDGILDIGIGRLPVSTEEEAELLVDKLINYDQETTIGEWRNFICLVGDDEDGNIHMKQANSLAEYIEEHYPAYNVNKIFMDAYPQETTPTGDRYPDVTRAINDQINRGALIINYTGHGGVTGLAHEKILDISNIKSWENSGKLPLFMTATCEFSRYDEYNASTKSEVSSAGEEVLLNPSGGSIALFTTTRLVYSGPNHVLNEKFYERVFEKDENGDCYRLGDIIKYSKNNAGFGINKRNFTLLGDPSTALAFPKNRIVTDSINQRAVEGFSDTISALDFVTVTGHVENASGELFTSFNGSVIPIVYDKKSNLKTLANDGGAALEFKLRNSILYKGNATVENGRFSFSFYVPRDISYVIGDGKISYYGYSDATDAHGASGAVTIGGIGDFAGTDTTGPAIDVYMNDSLFRNGGIVNSSPELFVVVQDPYGINTTGNGIGHDITATLDDDRFNAIVLNEYYQADPDSYSSGTVRYPYSNLSEGKHTISVKVWDIFNNSASSSVDFVVVESDRMLVEEVYNYPNPFINETRFNIEHNRPGEELEVFIRIYDISGSLVAVLNDVVYSPGYRVDPPVWQGTSSGGATLGGGIYVYQVVVKSEAGEEAVGSGKLIIRR